MKLNRCEHWKYSSVVSFKKTLSACHEWGSILVYSDSWPCSEFVINDTRKEGHICPWTSLFQGSDNTTQQPVTSNTPCNEPDSVLTSGKSLCQPIHKQHFRVSWITARTQYITDLESDTEQCWEPHWNLRTLSVFHVWGRFVTFPN